MEVAYKSKKLEGICTDLSLATRHHGKETAFTIHQRVAELAAADSVDMLVKFGVGRCHPLKGGRAGQYAMALTQPRRLVFEPVGQDGASSPATVRILEIVDYH